ncbi:MAG: hypothetical protein F6K65_34665 [Moorea sp. SIO3C2]|nr:hypothetical protein [Moorena sp. SIO3C2]
MPAVAVLPSVNISVTALEAPQTLMLRKKLKKYFSRSCDVYRTAPFPYYAAAEYSLIEQQQRTYHSYPNIYHLALI